MKTRKLISEIEDQFIRELAEKRAKENTDENFSGGDLLTIAFNWGNTPEDGCFWHDVYFGKSIEYLKLNYPQVLGLDFKSKVKQLSNQFPNDKEFGEAVRRLING